MREGRSRRGEGGTGEDQVGRLQLVVAEHPPAKLLVTRGCKSSEKRRARMAVVEVAAVAAVSSQKELGRHVCDQTRPTSSSTSMQILIVNSFG